MSAARPKIEMALAGGWVALSFFLTTVTTGLTPYFILLLAVIGAIWLGITWRRAAPLIDLPVILFWAAVVLLFLLFAVTAREPDDLLFILNFSMLILFPVLYTVFARLAEPRAATVFAILALAATTAIFLNVVADVTIFGRDRPNAPNRESNTATLFGFLTLVGLALPGGRWRLIFLLGPLLGVGATLITGSRGPVLAWPALTLIAAFLLVPRRLILPAILGLVLAGAGGLALLSTTGFFRSASIVEIAQDLAASGETADSTARIRLHLWEAGLGAIRDSPIVGHGWARIHAAAAPHMPAEAGETARELQQLHNDIINFAVAGGVFGVLAYLLIIATPSIAALRSLRDGQYRARVLGCLMLSADYFFCGLTDLTIGFEFRTAQFVVLAAILLGYCRDAPVPARAA